MLGIATLPRPVLWGTDAEPRIKRSVNRDNKDPAKITRFNYMTDFTG